MRLSISNIAWDKKNDSIIYDTMHNLGFDGLEIAPTRIFPEQPYDKLTEASLWSDTLQEKYGFAIPSMQSIWFGRQEKMFGLPEDRKTLAEYTKKAIDFAAVIGCENLVFGCPKNRRLPEGADPNIAVDFFRELGNYAAEKGTVIGMEANPPIYNTNYINDTLSAFALIKEVGSDGFRLNLDVGTMLQNGESVDELFGKVHLISHVHISEPELKPIEARKLHGELYQLLKAENYDGYISIEMGKTAETSIISEKMSYVKAVFGEQVSR